MLRLFLEAPDHPGRVGLHHAAGDGGDAPAGRVVTVSSLAHRVGRLDRSGGSDRITAEGLAALEPIIGELRTVVEDAETLRGTHARAERMLTGYARVAVDNPVLISVLSADPGVHSVLKANREWTDMIARQLALFADLRGLRVHQVRLAGGDASSDSYCYRS